MTYITISAFTDFAHEIGSDIKLVQGAGGNISFKNGNNFWVKASGTWLSEARHRKIFIKLELSKVLSAFVNKNSDFTSIAYNHSLLQPSIETYFHAIISQNIVVHVHSLNSIFWGVQLDGKAKVAERLEGLSWEWVDYIKPGLPLAQAIRTKLLIRPNIDVFLLANHGLIISADSIPKARDLLVEVEKRLLSPSLSKLPINTTKITALANMYLGETRLPNNPDIHLLAQNKHVLNLLTAGSLFPDQVVFLGPSISILQQDKIHLLSDLLLATPHCSIIPDIGVILGNSCSVSTELLLEFILHLTYNLPKKNHLRFLNPIEISELLNWDAEKVRQAADKIHAAQR